MPKRTTRQRQGSNPVIQITTTKPLIKDLDIAVESGYFGNSRAAAAERLLAEALRELKKEKGLIR